MQKSRVKKELKAAQCVWIDKSMRWFQKAVRPGWSFGKGHAAPWKPW